MSDTTALADKPWNPFSDPHDDGRGPGDASDRVRFIVGPARRLTRGGRAGSDVHAGLRFTFTGSTVTPISSAAFAALAGEVEE